MKDLDIASTERKCEKCEDIVSANANTSQKLCFGCWLQEKTGIDLKDSDY